jgi:hypothetical protein
MFSNLTSNCDQFIRQLLKFCGRNQVRTPPSAAQKIRNFFLLVQLAKYTVSNRCIAVKVPVPEGYGDFNHENTVLDELDREPRCADIVQSFLRLPMAKFMAFYSGGTLEQRLRIHQI